MASVMTMPRLSDTMKEGVLVRWTRAEGSPIQAGEVVAEVETDKATMELESFESGILVRQLLGAGQAIVVGGPIAIIAEEAGEDLSSVLASLGLSAPGAPGAVPSPTPAPASSVQPAHKPEPADVGDGRIKASPLAKKMAADHALPLGGIAGSGPGGRIVKRDIELVLQNPAAVTAPSTVQTASGVQASTAAPVDVKPTADASVRPSTHTPALQTSVTPAPASPGLTPLDAQRVPLSLMRKTIARRMVEAKEGVPHFYLTAEIDMGPAMALRASLNEAAAGSVKISVNDLVLKACAAALVKHPRINASFDGDAVLEHRGVHLGVAVAIDEGLITPTLRDCQQKSIGQLARESRELAERAQARKLKPDEYTGATFTVSNLGMYGIVEFVAIINPPQAAILAVGAVRDIPVVVNGALVVGKRMRMTLSCDHRVIDGALGAQFLATLREILENPMRLVL